MAIAISKALVSFDRYDTAEIKCGDGWFMEIKAFPMKLLAKEQAKRRSKGKGKKKEHVVPSLAQQEDFFNDVLTSDGEEETWLLDTYENDVDFFVENILVGWRGLTDDTGLEVTYSQEDAKSVFLDNGEPGKRLYRELLMSSMQSGIFVKTLEKQAEETAKN